MISRESDINHIDKRLRFERKFLLRDLDVYQLQNLVLMNKIGFIVKFHTRKINNIYFDTPNFEFYSASVRGYSQRKKVRIRWYGGMFGNISNAVLEIKFREGAVVYKNCYELGNLNLSNGSVITDQVNKALSNSKMPVDLVSDIKSLKPVLLNQYDRKYYESMSHNIRLTLDWDLKFFGISRYMNSCLNKTWESNISILELKYNREMEVIIDSIANQFPFRLTKSSKYVLGIDRVFNL